MSTPFVLAVPSKGRLQENAEAFFTHAGLSLAKPRGARDYRGTMMGYDNVEIAYLSASEIASATKAAATSPRLCPIVRSGSMPQARHTAASATEWTNWALWSSICVV